MDENKSKLTVKIFGNEYVIAGNNDEDYIQSIAGKVDHIMREIAKTNSRYSPAMVAVLTALNLADTLYKTQEEFSETQERLENLQAEMQRPFEELNNLTQELEAVREQYVKIQNEYTKTQIELGKISREWAKAQEELKDLRCELDVSRETINDVQNKLFENQIELLKTKKELDENKVRRFDKVKYPKANSHDDRQTR